MADSDSNSCDFSEILGDFTSDSECEEETIWYTGQIRGGLLDGYQFEPRRSVVAPDDEGDSDDGEDNGDEAQGEEDGDGADPDGPVPEAWKEDKTKFCECGHCETSTLTYRKEAVCCFSAHLGLRRVSAIDGQRICVAQDPQFVDCCLNQAVLTNQLIGLKNIRGDFVDINDIPQSKLRWMAYTAFTWWIYQNKLGRRNRRIIPACVTTRIREKFGQDEEVFVPFADAPDTD